MTIRGEPPTLTRLQEHYWEIGQRTYRLSRLRQDIQAAGIRIVKSYRVFEWTYNRIFVLEAGTVARGWSQPEQDASGT